MSFVLGKSSRVRNVFGFVYPFPTVMYNSSIIVAGGESRSRVLYKSIKLFTEHSLRIVTIIGPIKRYPVSKWDNTTYIELTWLNGNNSKYNNNLLHVWTNSLFGRGHVAEGRALPALRTHSFLKPKPATFAYVIKSCTTKLGLQQQQRQQDWFLPGNELICVRLNWRPCQTPPKFAKCKANGVSERVNAEGVACSGAKWEAWPTGDPNLCSDRRRKGRRLSWVISCAAGQLPRLAD